MRWRRWAPTLGAAGLFLPSSGCVEVEGPPRAQALVMVGQAGVAAGTHPVLTAVTAPSVLVTDEDGTPIPGVAVVFSAVRGQGVVFPHEAITGVDGVASAASWTFGRVAGAQEVQATLGTSTQDVSVSFAGTAIPGPPSRIALSASDFNLLPGTEATLVVRPADVHRNPTGAPIAASFVSSDPLIASVDAAGVLTAHDFGPVRVIATSGPDADTAFVGVGRRPAGAPRVAHDTPQAPWAVALGTDDLVHAVSGIGNRLYSYSATTGLPTGFADLEGPGIDIALTPDLARAVVVQPDLGALRVVDLSTHQVVRTVEGLGTAIRLALAPNGDAAFVGTTVGLRRVDLTTGAVTAIDFAGGSNGIEVDAERGVLYVSTLPGELLEVSIASFTILRWVSLAGGLPQGVALAPGGRIYVANETYGLQLVDVATFTLLDTFAAYAGAYDVAVTQDGRHVFVSRSQAGVISVVDTFTHGEVAAHPGGAYRRMAAAADGRSIVAANAAGGIVILR